MSARLARTVRALSIAWLFLALVIVPSSARAIDVATIKDRLSDPLHLLSKRDRKELSDRLTKTQKATLIDVAFLLVDAPEEDLEAIGRQAFTTWKLTNDSESGIIFVVPMHGQAVMVQGRVPPVLAGRELKIAVGADKKNSSAFDRIDSLSKNIEKLLRLHVLRKKPRGITRPVRGMVYLTGAVALLMLAVMRTLSEREKLAAATA